MLGTGAVAALTLPGGPPADAAPKVATEPFVDGNAPIVHWMIAHKKDPRVPVLRERIAEQPKAVWFTTYDPTTITKETREYVGAAVKAVKVPMIVSYMLPNRDCGGPSAGGAPDWTTYDEWVANFARGLGSQRVLVFLEPDSVSLLTCLSKREVAERNAALKGAVTAIKAANPKAEVYLDGGHSSWNPPTVQAKRLERAGVTGADGFYTNASNYRTTEAETKYGKALLRAIGGNGLRFVIDTSRNGNGPRGLEWCDPKGRKLGRTPTLETGDRQIAGYPWIKAPGEADGCKGVAGTFYPKLAYELATNPSR